MDTQTDGQTHRRTDRLIPVYPRKHLFYGGIKTTDILPDIGGGILEESKPKSGDLGDKGLVGEEKKSSEALSGL